MNNQTETPFNAAQKTDNDSDTRIAEKLIDRQTETAQIIIELNEKHNAQLNGLHEKREQVQQELTNTKTNLAMHQERNKIVAKLSKALTEHAELSAFYHVEIDQAKKFIASLTTQMEPEQTKLSNIENLINNELYHYKKTEDEFYQKLQTLKSFEKHKAEFVDADQSRLLNTLHAELSELELKLLDIEIELLEKEKQRLKIAAEIKPIKDEIQGFNNRLILLESEKSKKDMTAYLQLITSAISNDNAGNIELLKNSADENGIVYDVMPDTLVIEHDPATDTTNNDTSTQS